MSEEFWQAIGGIVTLLLSVLSLALKSYVSSKTKNENALAALDWVGRAATVAAQDTAQVYVKAIKEASADGKLTEEEKKQAKERALLALKLSLGQKGQELIKEHIGLEGAELELFLSSHLEAAISKIPYSVGLRLPAKESPPVEVAEKPSPAIAEVATPDSAEKP